MSRLQHIQDSRAGAHDQIAVASDTVDILGVRVHTLRLDELLATIANIIATRQRAIIGYANIHALNLAYEVPWFRAFLNQSDIVFCDGFGVKWGARLLGARIPERFTAPDCMARLAASACQQDFSLFFFGARHGVAQKAAEILQAAAPGLRIAGVHHGYFDKTLGGAENKAVIRSINAARPALLIVGFGMPTQERWLMENWDRLEVNVALTAGAVFDHMTGEVTRAPAWMTDHGLEWLGRLAVEPRRLWRRYLIGNPLFLARVLRQRLGKLVRIP
jgi:N-acetylglucosaminyldiphosphoundecaprenol N-acetyl-beta-D-mannosaminyltransferase